jgi:xanthine dehydrogenase accessory factor
MDIYKVIGEYLTKGMCGTIATIVEKIGATPQGIGAKMFIGEDGRIFGTIGGGCMEAEVWQESRKMLVSKEGRLFHYSLDGKQVEDEGMICGGSIDVFLEVVLERYSETYKSIAYFQKRGIRALIITRFGKNGFSKSLFTLNGEVIGDTLENNMAETFQNLFYEKKPTILNDMIVEPIEITSNLYIYGAGHLSQFISKLAKMMDFNVIVIDDRKEFANRERFPEADEIIVNDFNNITQDDGNDGERYVVIVTRGHKHDAVVLKEVLKRNNRYVGMIGSKRKTKIIFDHLNTCGIEEKLLQTVHAPIGIDINSETPQEIALSIIAELVKARGEKN